MKKIIVSLLTPIAVIGLITVSMAQNLPSYVPSNGLVGWWPFNGNANDESGNGNHGTVNGSTLTTDRFGNQNGAYSFDGVNDFIQLPNNPSIAPQNISVSCWFKINSTTTDQTLIRLRFSGYSITYNFTFQFGPIASDKLATNFFITGGANYAQPFSNVVNDNNWHNIVFTFDGLIYSVYIDGNQTFSASNFGSGSLLYNNSGNGYAIGRDGDNSNWYFGGLFDDLGIWNRALTQQEITNLYNAQSPCQVSIISQPVNQTVGTNRNVQFSVVSSDSSSTYRWQSNSGFGFRDLNNNVQYAGVNTSTLNVSNISRQDNNQLFRCIVSTVNCGSDTSDVAALNFISPTRTASIPNKFTYQSVVRDSSGQLVTNQPVGLRVTLQRAPQMTQLYTETHQLTTNATGLLSAIIGAGLPIFGNMDTIDWSGEMVYVKAELDMNGGTAYSLLSSRELLSVPYALYSVSTSNGNPGPAGPQGPQGVPGPQGPVGSPIPSGGLYGQLLYNCNGVPTWGGCTPLVTTAPLSYSISGTPRTGGVVTSDGGSTIIARGVVYDTITNPTLANRFTNNGTGTGQFSSSLSGLSPSTTYYVRAYATNSVGTSYGQELSFTTDSVPGLRCSGTPTVSDADGNLYYTVQIGTQCWMQSNLKASKYQNGDSIFTSLSNSQWQNITTGAYSIYDNDPINDTLYGKLYNHYAVTDSRGLCPTGWHVPTDGEWTVLEGFLGGSASAGGPLKSNAIQSTPGGWSSPNTGATNSTGFTATPGGLRLNSGVYTNISNNGYWWSSVSSGANAWARTMNFNGANVERNSYTRNHGAVVRCLQNSLPQVNTTAIINVTHSTAVVTGNVLSEGDQGQPIRGFCYDTLSNPTVSSNTAVSRSGGGVYTGVLQNLSPLTTYYVRAYATNSVGTSYGQELSFTTDSVPGVPCSGTPTVSDGDGNIYYTVQIGTQCWMQSNLKASKYRNGDIISTGLNNSQWSSTSVGAYAVYNNDTLNDGLFGKLYNHYAVTDSRGLCPTGWHVPTDGEWTVLEGFLGGSASAGGPLKSNSIQPTPGGWSSPNTGATNSTGFTATPGGLRLNTGVYSNISNNGYWWSSVSFGANAWARTMNFNGANVVRNSYTRNHGAVVRCLQNSLPQVNTTAIINVTHSTAVVTGNVLSEGDQNLLRGFCYDTLSNPTVSSNTAVSGSGGGVYTGVLQNLFPLTTYYVRAYATNSVGTSYGQELSFTTDSVPGLRCSGTPTVSDADGNIYYTVQIGTQCWMQSNLKASKYRNGDGITTSLSNFLWQAATLGAYSIFNNDTLNDGLFGKLYNHYAVTDSRGLCPTGWHVPTDGEWTVLEGFLGGSASAGGPLKSNSIQPTPGGWSSPNTGATNSTGFTATPGGLRLNTGVYSNISNNGYWWSSVSFGANAWARTMYFNGANVVRNSYTRNHGAVVRCLQNSLPQVNTTAIINVTHSTAVVTGNVLSAGDQGQPIRGFCYDTLSNPTVSSNTAVSGSGGGVYTGVLQNLSPLTTYYVRAYATNSVGTSYGQELSFTTDSVPGVPCSGTPTVSDADGNIYYTVQIGTQCWMQSNLKASKYRNGDIISTGLNNSQWSSTSVGAYAVYNNDTLNDGLFGKLYNHYAVTDSRGLCPTGWHVSTDGEWTVLEGFLGGSASAGGPLKSNSIQPTPGGWSSPNTGATNSTGFTATPGGLRLNSGEFNSFNTNGYWWSSVSFGANAWSRTMNFNGANVVRNSYTRNHGAVVRCLQNSLPQVNTTAIINVTHSTSVVTGNVLSEGDQNLLRGFCYDTLSNPTVSSNTAVSGSGGGVYTGVLQNLSPLTTYYVRAYATNSLGTSYGQELSFTTDSVPGVRCSGTPTVSDGDGNIYYTVQIGTQCWMQSNLKASKYQNGDSIFTSLSNSQWQNITTGAYSIFNNDPLNDGLFGKLYNHYAVTDSRGLCPTGWHVPTDGEWTVLEGFLGGSASAGGPLKSNSIQPTPGSWSSPNTGATNSTGFTATPGGLRLNTGVYSNISNNGYWWSSVSFGANAWARTMYFNGANVVRNSYTRNHGAVVRCLQNSLPQVNTTAIINVTHSTAVVTGNVLSEGDQGQPIRGFCYDTLSNPTVSSSTAVSGSGGGVYTGVLQNLFPLTTYYVRAYATNSVGTSYGQELSFTTDSVPGLRCSGTPTVSDGDGNIYYTVQIGTQCWMHSNLKASKYRNGDIISTGLNNSQWSSTSVGAYAVYNNDTLNDGLFGKLYNHYAVTDSRGLCPTGWHVPTDGEWTVLEGFLGGSASAGGPLKSNSIQPTPGGWSSPNTGATNSTGFTATPGGLRLNSGEFNSFNTNGYWWSSSVSTGSAAWIRYLNFNDGVINRNLNLLTFGFSVRCLLDSNSGSSSAVAPTISTTTASSVTLTGATTGGNVSSDGGSAVTARGVAYATAQNPTTSNSTTSNGTGAGVFTSTLSGLTSSTVYYVRAYATNSVGTGYGNQVIFTTTSITLPSVITTTASSVTTTGAITGGNVISDGGASVTARGVAYGMAQNPTISGTITNNGTGTGAFTSSLTGLTASTSYFVRAYATNSVGTAYGNEVSFTTTGAGPSFTCGTSTVSDLDNNTYNTVQIGTQCWTQSNLKVSKYRNGDNIPTGLSNSQWSSTTSGSYAIYDNNPINDSVFGKLYNHYAVTDSRGLCPTGWHVPSHSEWNLLAMFLDLNADTICVFCDQSPIAGGALKSTLTQPALGGYIFYPTSGATNSSGFTGLPGGRRHSSGGYDWINDFAFWWTSTNQSNSNAWYRNVSAGGPGGPHQYHESRTFGRSIRCVRDLVSGGGSATAPTVATTTASSVTTTGAITGGNVTSDGGATVTARGVAYGTAQNPTTANSTTSDGTGTGAFTSTLTGLTASTLYYVRSYATNAVGTAYGNEVSFTTTGAGPSFTCGTSTVSDLDNNTYNTVQIGTQCWTQSNLKVSKYRNGDSIPTGLNNSQWSLLTSGAYAIYDNDPVNDGLYGKLYNHYAVSDIRGLCPTGWHVPSRGEVIVMVKYLDPNADTVCNGCTLSSIAGGALKSTATQPTTGGWTSPNIGATNSSGFTSLPAGYRDLGTWGGGYWQLSNESLWWTTSTGGASGGAWGWNQYNYDANFRGGFGGTYQSHARYGFSVRCLKDSSSGGGSASLPTVTTTSATGIGSTGATTGGDVTADGGATVTARGVAYGTAQNPTTANSITSDGTGTGVFTSTLSGLTASTLYYVRAYATNAVGTAYGNEVSFTTSAPQPCPGTPTVTDVDNNTYNTVQIGTQCWMQSNLKVSKYRNGDNIPSGLSNSAWQNTTIGAYAIYDNNSVNDGLYGKLYNHYAVTDSRGLCPTGWHVPSDAEWTTLENQLGGSSVAGGALKSTAMQPTPGGWASPNTGATNSSGFTALPGGLRFDDGDFDVMTYFGFWWSSTVSPGSSAWSRDLYDYTSGVTRGSSYRTDGFSVRCCRD